jgi:hypothetical protein
MFAVRSEDGTLLSALLPRAVPSIFGVGASICVFSLLLCVSCVLCAMGEWLCPLFYATVRCVGLSSSLQS